MKIFLKIIILSLFLGLFYSWSVGLKPVFAQNNLIPNSSLEEMSANNQPLNWYKGRWGINNVSFTFSNIGPNGVRALNLVIANHSTGDAKWYFSDITTAGQKKYEFSDYYKSDVVSYVTVRYLLSDNSFLYKDIAILQPSTDFIFQKISFINPPNAQSFTIFHLIKQNGTLSTSVFNLQEIISEQNNNLINNSDLEVSELNGLPTNWQKGRWGTNTALFSYPTTGFNNSKATKITISNHSTGDAKWYFPDIKVNGGEFYDFSNFYQSDVETTLTVRYLLNNGQYKYIDLKPVPPSNLWEENRITFKTPPEAKSLTIFHLINKNGYLSVDNFYLKKLSGDPNIFDTGIISISFDDGWLSSYENALPILEENGLKATYYIVLDYLENNYIGYINYNQLIDLKNHGHEIGSHSMSHSNLTLIPPEQLFYEINNSRTLLENSGFSINSLAYPFGAFNDQVIKSAKESLYSSGRGTNTGLNFKDTDPLQLKATSLKSTMTLEEIKQYINNSIQQKGWLILSFHQISNNENLYNINPEKFSQIVNYIKEKNIPVVTVSEGLKLMLEK